MQCVNLEPLFILHSRPYRDTSLLLDALTQKHGLITLVARSARGLKSRYKGILQLFSPFLASWSGKHELKNLGNVEREGPVYFLEKQSLVCGFYLNELVKRLLQRDDPNPEIYHLYKKTLYHLEKAECLQLVVRLFEKKLLDALGYGLPLCREAKTQSPIVAHLKYRYLPQCGFIEHLDSEGGLLIFSGKTLLSLQENSFHDMESLQEAKCLLRLVLNEYLDNKPIKSRELLF